mgnify:CR=1 FL=1
MIVNYPSLIMILFLPTLKLNLVVEKQGYFALFYVNKDT